MVSVTLVAAGLVAYDADFGLHVLRVRFLDGEMDSVQLVGVGALENKQKMEFVSSAAVRAVYVERVCGDATNNPASFQASGFGLRRIEGQRTLPNKSHQVPKT